VLDLTLLLDVVLKSTWALMPILLAALGEIFSERSGVVNIGLEGIMLLSALAAVAVADYFLNPWAGVLAGVGMGLLIGVVHGVISVYLKGDQVISGIGVNLFAYGFVAYAIEVIWHVRGYYTPRYEAKMPRLPVIGVSPLFILSIALAIVMYFILYKTDYGLKVRAVGENPEAADVVGIHVERTQFISTLVGAALAGLGGTVLSIDWLAAITKELPAGRGFIALAIVNFANWNPTYALGGSFVFGFLWTLSEYLKNLEVAKALIPIPLINTIPYIATLAITAGLIGRARPPRHVGKPYKKE